MFTDEQDLKFNQCFVSLQDISASNIVCNLWITEKDQISKSLYNDALWRNSEDIVLNKIKQLSLPQTISSRLASLTESVGTQLKNWITFHDEYLSTEQFNAEGQHSDDKAINFLRHIRWTNDGKIDLKQTAINIVEYEHKLNAKKKYQLACLYCLEDKLEAVSFSNRNKYMSLTTKNKYPMLYYWTNVKYAKSMAFTKEVLKLVLDCKFNNYEVAVTYEVAVKFLWTTLTEIQKSESINDIIRKLGFSSFTYSLFLTLDLDEQKNVFKRLKDFLSNPSCILDLIKNWHITNFFPMILNNIEKRVYVRLLYDVIFNITRCQSQNDRFCYVSYHKTMLETLWKETPNRLKDYAFRKGLSTLLLLLEGDVNYDLIELMLSGVSDELKKEIIFSESNVDKCAHYIETKEWDMDRLDLYIKANLSTAENQEEFKALVYRRKKRRIL